MIEASAPIRICDNGGWTDTWFGGPGRVLNIAVTPGVEVSIGKTTGPDPGRAECGELRRPVPGGPWSEPGHAPPLAGGGHRLVPSPRRRCRGDRVRSQVPAGCSTGTSAAVAVALLGALAARAWEELSPRDAAYAAHQIEVDILGAESGIQDQLSSAFGGINYIEIEPYPEAKVYPLPAWDELGPMLTLVFLGHAHDSSAVHQQVIEGVRTSGSQAFSLLRDAAIAARTAVLTQDLDAFGKAMIANTEAQRSLHRELVGADAGKVIEIAAALGAAGWKINGAGGDGGSITILNASREAKGALEGRVTAEDPRYRVLPIQVSPCGLRVRGAL